MSRKSFVAADFLKEMGRKSLWRAISSRKWAEKVLWRAISSRKWAERVSGGPIALPFLPPCQVRDEGAGRWPLSPVKSEK